MKSTGVTAVFLAGVLALCGPAAAGPVTVPLATDLPAEAREAAQRRVPILILFSQPECGYCELVKEEFLRPMIRSGEYEDKVLIRRVELGTYDTLLDFDGGEVEADEFAHRYGASLTPTVVFLDADGRPLAPSLVGVVTVDFYGGDLDARIDEARARLHAARLGRR